MSSTSARILIVDDDPLIRTAIARRFRGHEVELAASGREALERLLAGARYDVVFCDIVMPEMSGIELYEQLCARELDPESIVFVTGDASEEVQRFLERTLAPCLEKPFSSHALVAVVAERLARR